MKFYNDFDYKELFYFEDHYLHSKNKYDFSLKDEYHNQNETVKMHDYGLANNFLYYSECYYKASVAVFEYLNGRDADVGTLDTGFYSFYFLMYQALELKIKGTILKENKKVNSKSLKNHCLTKMYEDYLRPIKPKSKFEHNFYNLIYDIEKNVKNGVLLRYSSDKEGESFFSVTGTGSGKIGFNEISLPRLFNNFEFLFNSISSTKADLPANFTDQAFPKPGDYETYSVTAINHEEENLGAHYEGYKRIGLLLFNLIQIEKQFELFIPAWFIMHQAIELALKEMLLSLTPNKSQKQLKAKGHQLSNIWDNFKKQADCYLNLSSEGKKAMDVVDELINNLKEFDKGGFMFRFPPEKPIKSKLNVSAVRICFQMILYSLDYINDVFISSYYVPSFDMVK